MRMAGRRPVGARVLDFKGEAVFDNRCTLVYKKQLRSIRRKPLTSGDPAPNCCKEMKMKKTGYVLLLMLLAIPILFALPACQKKQIASDAGGTASSSSAGMGGTAGRKGIGEQDLGAGAGRPGAAGSTIGVPERSAFENEDIFFGYDSSAITAEAQEVLRRKAAFLKANPNIRITVEGHCDERGTNEYNLALGEARAKSAKAFLVDLGISANRIATISYGEERPLVEGRTEEAYAKNRRAHFVIER